MYFAGNTKHFRFKFPNPAKQGSNSPPIGHRRPSSARSFPRGRVCSSFKLIGALHCSWLPEQQQQQKWNNSRLAEFFASLRSFPILSFQSSIPLTVSFLFPPLYSANPINTLITDTINQINQQIRKGTKKKHSQMFDYLILYPWDKLSNTLQTCSTNLVRVLIVVLLDGVGWKDYSRSHL